MRQLNTIFSALIFIPKDYGQKEPEELYPLLKLNK